MHFANALDRRVAIGTIGLMASSRLEFSVHMIKYYVLD